MEDVVATLKVDISTLKDVIFEVEAYLKAKVACLQILEQQLAAIENKKAIKVMDLQGGQPDPVKMALEIPVILDNILEKLDFETLMSSRPVSKYWNEAAVTVFSKNTKKGEPSRRLNLRKLFETCDFDFLPELEAKLSKKIYFIGSCTCYMPYYRGSVCYCKPYQQKFLMFLEKYSAKMEEMNLELHPSYAPTFFKAIANACPNLKALYLKGYNYSAEPLDPQAQAAEAADLAEIEAIPQEQLFRMNLTTIEFENGVYQPKSFHESIQRIIDRAPNLVRLKLKGKFYIPNLTNNKTLKYLYFEGYTCNQNFSQTKLSQMLCQVKDSLEALEIKTDVYENPNSEVFTLPQMKILQKLVIWNVFGHPFEQDGRTAFQTIASQFPNLVHLELRSQRSPQESEENGVEMLLKNLKKGPLTRLPKIRTLILDLDRIQDPSFLNYFASWFPNLTKLKLTMEKGWDIGPVFSALSGLKLKHFSFAMEFYFSFSNLVQALVANPELFKGLEFLEIAANHDEKPYMHDDLEFEGVVEKGERKSYRKVFCEWLQSVAKMKAVNFEGFNFYGETALKVILLIAEQQLPVNFINDF